VLSVRRSLLCCKVSDSKPHHSFASFLSSATKPTANFPPVLLAPCIVKVAMDLPSARRNSFPVPFAFFSFLTTLPVIFRSMPWLRSLPADHWPYP
jgi:hypothetical protein